MAITITLHTTVFGQWEEGADERERLDNYSSAHVITAEDMQDAVAEGQSLPAYIASVLTAGRGGSDCYAVFASDSPRVNERTWYSAEGHEDPATGELTETSYHLEGPEWTYALAREVAAIAKWTA